MAKHSPILASVLYIYGFLIIQKLNILISSNLATITLMDLEFCVTLQKALPKIYRFAS